jgi:hypothetical protein
MSEKFTELPASESGKIEIEDFVQRLQKRSGELYPEGDRVMSRFIETLNTADISAAKIFIIAESDKFRSYGEETLYLIIDTIFDGKGSPWKSLEQKRLL